MTQSAPDGISPSQLEDFAQQAKDKAKAEKKAAKKAERKAKKGPHDGLTDDQVIELANKMLDKLYEKCGSPVAHKVAAMQVIHNLMRWHSNMAHSEAEGGDVNSSLAWAADAGRLKAALDIMRSISLMPDDFTYRPDDEFNIFPPVEGDD